MCDTLVIVIRLVVLRMGDVIDVGRGWKKERVFMNILNYVDTK